MKKFIAFVFLAFMLILVTENVIAQKPPVAGKDAKKDVKTEVVKTDTAQKAADTTAVAPAVADTAAQALTAPVEEEKSFHYVLKEKFIEGGTMYMFPILLCLIIGLALVIERILYLNLSSTNTDKLLKKVEEALANGGPEKAKDVCRNTRGPVASIYYQGLDRINEGLDVVEKSIVSYGSVLMGRLEMNLTWIALFIAIAPMLGFLGTVIGMVGAFDAIAEAGDISPAIVAGGIKIALITTVFGLIVAIILQVFYNYLLSKIDGIVNNMENATISFMDIVIKHNKK
ncbi:MAG: Biopolymer transport protein ExbB [Bacteroidetes bacterium ADurb.Bin408]|nr:MAG: Biopolymer transport protein ExbB [Bacteroidetes bacterium ADurb.Bin408]